MDTFTTPTDDGFHFRVVDGSLLMAPVKRPDDWREIPAARLSRWAARQWRENAFQPTVKDEQP